MPKLNDTQGILMSTAAQRDTYSLYPLPDTLKDGARVSKAITTLLSQALAAERETTDPATIHRTDGDISYGVFATDAGLAAIGVTNGAGKEEIPEPARAPTPRVTKASMLIELLSGERGASLDEMIAATDWLPHTVRAAMTGLRKKGHTLSNSKVDGKTRWTIVAAADHGEG